jgi:hypothetical protein
VEVLSGDLRAMLTHLSQQRPMLLDDYAHASDVGKKFLEGSVWTVDLDLLLRCDNWRYRLTKRTSL